MGFRVIAMDIGAEKLEYCTSCLGAEKGIDVLDENCVEEV
jgi:NADPH-dependent curcumin reductase CurA